MGLSEGLQNQFRNAQLEVTMKINYDANDYPMIVLDDADMTEEGALYVGQKIEYYSKSQDKWYETTITNMDESNGSIQTRIKPNVWVTKGEQATQVRLAGAYNKAGAAPHQAPAAYKKDGVAAYKQDSAAPYNAVASYGGATAYKQEAAAPYQAPTS